MLLSRTFAALAERDFRLYYLGQVASLTGSWVERTALAWLVYRITGDSEAWLGYVSFAPLLPVLLLSVPAGALADRMDVRKVVIATQGLMLLGAAGVATVTYLGAADPEAPAAGWLKWAILGYAVLSSALFAVDAPARQTLLARLVPPEKFTNAIALGAASFNVSRAAGSAFFGLLMAHTDIGEAGCMALNALSFACILASLFALRPLPPRKALGEHNSHYLEGFRYVLRTKPVRAALAMTVTMALFAFQISHLLPVYAKKVWHGGEGAFAQLSASLALGALLGSLTVATHGHALHRGRRITLCAFLVPAVLLAVAKAPQLWVGTALVFVLGFVTIQSHSACNALIQSSVPDELRGRVMSIYTLAVLGSFPLGGLMGGMLAEVAGAPTATMLAASIVLVLASTVFLTHPTLRDVP